MTLSGPLAMAILGLMAGDPAARMVPDQVEALLSRASSGSAPPSGPVSGWEPWPEQRPHLPAGHIHPEQRAYGSEPPRPVSWPVREQPTGTGEPARRTGAGRLALLAGIPVFVVAVGVGGWLVVRNQDGGADTGSGRPGVTAPITKASPPATAFPPDLAMTPTASPAATPRPSRTVPMGWRRHRDPMGFSVRVPKDWTFTRFSGRSRVEFRAPGANGFLWIESTNDPEKDPVRHWEKVERAGTAANVWPGYERIGITSLRYQGVSAADWEFTYLKNGVRTHVLDRGFRTSTGRPYAIYWESPESEWDRSLFDGFTRTFTP